MRCRADQLLAFRKDAVALFALALQRRGIDGQQRRGVDHFEQIARLDRRLDRHEDFELCSMALVETGLNIYL